jgi:hypothetical protein
MPWMTVLIAIHQSESGASERSLMPTWSRCKPSTLIGRSCTSRIWWIGIAAGVPVFVAALAVPLGDLALLLALVLALRGGRIALDNEPG